MAREGAQLFSCCLVSVPQRVAAPRSPHPLQSHTALFLTQNNIKYEYFASPRSSARGGDWCAPQEDADEAMLASIEAELEHTAPAQDHAARPALASWTNSSRSWH